MVLVAAAAVAGVVAVGYALKHHITVAQAKAKAEAVVAKVKLEVAKIESEAKVLVSADEAKVAAALSSVVNRVKALL